MLGRRVAPLAFALLLLAGCVQPAITPGATDAPAGPATALGFSPLTPTDASKYGSEPSVAVDSKGRIYVSAPSGLTSASYLWVSEDDGASWKQLDPNPFKANGKGLGGGDTSIAIGPDDSVWVTDLWAGSSTVSVSKDGGKTWTASPVGSQVPYNDREWNTVDSKGRGYYLGRTFTPGVATWVARSDDGGLTWLQVGNPWISGPGADEANMGRQNGGMIANPKTDAIGVVYSCATRAVCVSTSSDQGMTWKQAVAARGEGSVANLFPAIAADTDGNWYVAYAESVKDGGHVIKIAASADGRTWGEPIAVTTTSATRLMPWIVAGDPGRVAVAWYETDVLADSNDVGKMKDARWNVALAVGVDALGESPTFDVRNVSAEPVHKGSVSTRGLSPGDPNPPDRGLGDFFTIALDPQGKAHLSFGVGSKGEKFSTVHARQLEGPSLYAAGHAPERAAQGKSALDGVLDALR